MNKITIVPCNFYCNIITVVKNYGVLTTLWTKKSLPFFPAAYSSLIIGAIKFCAVVNIIKSLLKSCVKKRFTYWQDEKKKKKNQQK